MAGIACAFVAAICPPRLYGQAPTPTPTPRFRTAQSTPSNFRASPGAVDLPPEPGSAQTPKKKKKPGEPSETGEPVDPATDPDAVEPAPEDAPTPEDIARERKKRREEERQRRELEARIQEINTTSTRDSFVARDLMEVPGAGVGDSLGRLSAEQSLLGKRWSINGGAYVSSVYDDNVQVSEVNKQADMLITVGASVAGRIGTGDTGLSISAGYGIGYVYFLDETSDAALSHNFNLDARYRFTKLTLGLIVTADYGTGGTVDVGARVNRTNYFASITANYAFTEKVSFDFSASGASTGYEDLLSGRETRVRGFVDYAFTAKLKLGLGGSVGMLKTEEGTTQQVNQILTRASYTATEKIRISGDLGTEFRETGGGNETTPVLSLGVAYRPFERTTITADAYRRVYSSASMDGQDYTASGLSLSARQDLLPRLGLSLGGGYEHTEYFGSEEGVEASRQDDYFFFRTSLDWEIARWCRSGIFYEFSQSDSTGQGAKSFERNRFGLQVSVMF